MLCENGCCAAIEVIVQLPRGLKSVCGACAAEGGDPELLDATDILAALPEAMFRSQFSNPNGEGVDREWLKPHVQGEWEYRAAVVKRLLYGTEIPALGELRDALVEAAHEESRR